MTKTRIAVFLVLATGIAAFGRLSAQEGGTRAGAAPPPTAKAGPIQEVLRTKRVDVNFEGTPLADVLNYLRSRTNINIVLDPNLQDEEGRERLITFAAQDVSLEAFLDIIAGRRLVYEVKENVVVITRREPTTAAPAPAGPPTEQETQLRERLKTNKVDINFEATPLSDVIAFLRGQSKLNIVLDPDIEDDEIRHRLVTLRLNDVSLGAVLELIAGKDIVVTVKDNVVVLSERAPKALSEAQKPEDKEARIRRLLDTRRTTVEYDGAKLSEVIDYLSGAAHVPIVFDPTVLDWNDVKDRPVTVRLANVSIATILDVILGKDLAYVVKGEAVVITRK
jgi:hypothetical protein